MRRVEACVVVWVACLAGHVLGQLGVVSVDEDKEEELNTIISTDDLLPNKQEKGLERDDDGVWEDTWSEGRYKGSVEREGRRRRPVLDTYQGCYYEEVVNGTLMYVNLTQVMEVNDLESVEDACFHMCSVKKPFTLYIGLSPAVSRGTDGCGCMDVLEHSNKVDDDGCDDMVKHFRVYCGPSNTYCINQAGRKTVAPLLLCLPLAALLRSLVWRNKDVYTWL